jgi:hypothetical protein
LPHFVGDFGDCVRSSFTKIYAVARQHSKLSAEQFRQCMKRIGAPLKPAPAAIKKLFNPYLIDDAFLVTEYAFDSVVLKRLMLDRLAALPVDVRLQTEVVALRPASDERIEVDVRTPHGDATLDAAAVFQCGYSRLNQPTATSAVPVVPLKHELAEMALVEVPESLAEMGITVMDGPFFSLMPFPSTPYHTLSHVRYTPHANWFDAPGAYRRQEDMLAAQPRQTAFPFMIRDAARYLPAAAECRYRDSLWEVKTILPRNEADDGRPILFLPHHGLRNYHVVLGGKIDNVYDILDRIRHEPGLAT